MRLLLSCVCCCALVSVVSAQDKWVTIKGQVVFPADKQIPKPAALKVDGPDKVACLAKGAILDESVLVNPKTRGIKNVVVYLRPDDADNLKAEFTKEQIHPDDKTRKPAEVIIDQPCCVFVKRVTVARVGDTIIVKNPAAIAHNFFWESNENGTHNPAIPAGMDFKLQPLKKEPTPIQYKCTIHPWMTGYVRIFDHPHYALTDENGNFEIKNAPAGKFRIVYWHETPGVRGGAKGRAGDQIEIALPQGAKTMEMKPIDFDVSPK